MLGNICRRLAAMVCTLAVFLGFGAELTASAFNFTPVKGRDGDGNLIKLDLYSDSAYMINMDTGDVIVDVKSTKQRVPASLTKIMTAIVLLDEFDGDKDDMEAKTYSAPQEMFDELWNWDGASRAYIEPEEKVNCYDLLCALMIPSGCDAANVIAYGMCGSIDAFCDRMNETAARIGMKDSHFSCAHGLSSDNNYSTCQDIAKACMYAINNYDVFREVVGMSTYYMTPTEQHPDDDWYLQTTNEMLNAYSGYYYSTCMGIKTGTLDTAGRCLASYAVSNGRRYLTVTMGAPLEKQEKDIQKGWDNPDSVFAYDEVYYNFVDHMNLYNWAFVYLEDREIVDPSSEVQEAKVEFGDKGRDYVTLTPQSGCRVTFPIYIEEKDIVRDITVYDNVVAPVRKGDELGRIKVSFEGEQIADIPLIATGSVSRSRAKELKAIAKSFPKSRAYKVVLALCIFGILVYTVIYVLWVQNKYMKK